MIEKEYAKAYREVIEILEHVTDENLSTIPKEKIEYYRKNMDISYNYKIDETKELEEQEISEITKAILANLFRDYWATPEQKERIKAKEKYDLQKIDEENRRKYNPDDIFKNRQKEDLETSVNLPVEIKKETFFIKLINFIKSIFGKN